MKAILEFNLPEEQEEFKYAQKGGEYLNALQMLANQLRSNTKYSETEPGSWQDVSDWFWGVLKEEEVELL